MILDSDFIYVNIHTYISIYMHIPCGGGEFKELELAKVTCGYKKV
jgi:hypothetical protein